MCVNSSVFPLVRLKNGKRKVLFNCDFKVTNIEDYKNIKNQIEQIRFGILGVSKSHYINSIMKKYDVKSIEDIIAVPCGKCEDCLKANARSWALRILQEAKQYKENYFLTLTYDDEHLPKYGSLDKEAISKFNKKLKTYLKRKGLDSEFRFYSVGEYGEQFLRPHYHGIYFNLPLIDLKFTHYSENGFPCYESEFLNNIWSCGFVEVQDVSIGSACYVARYCDKKKKNLTREDLDMMKKFNLEPEFSRMSRRPGIGANYLDKILENVKNGVYKIQYKDNDFSIPKYYSKKFEELLDPDILVQMKKYNNMVADNFTYKNIMASVDIEQQNLYNEFVVSKHKKKRGF